MLGGLWLKKKKDLCKYLEMTIYKDLFDSLQQLLIKLAGLQVFVISLNKNKTVVFNDCQRGWGLHEIIKKHD